MSHDFPQVCKYCPSILFKEYWSSFFLSFKHKWILCYPFGVGLVVCSGFWSVFLSRSQVQFFLVSISVVKSIQSFVLALNGAPLSGRWDWFPRISQSLNLDTEFKKKRKEKDFVLTWLSNNWLHILLGNFFWKTWRNKLAFQQTMKVPWATFLFFLRIHIGVSLPSKRVKSTSKN